MIGRPTRRDVIESGLSKFTDEDEAFAIQLVLDDDTSDIFGESLTVITTDPPKLGDYYTVTLEKS